MVCVSSFLFNGYCTTDEILVVKVQFTLRKWRSTVYRPSNDSLNQPLDLEGFRALHYEGKVVDSLNDFNKQFEQKRKMKSFCDISH